jgi:hypothetical protein
VVRCHAKVTRWDHRLKLHFTESSLPVTSLVSWSDIVAYARANLSRLSVHFAFVSLV